MRSFFLIAFLAFFFNESKAQIIAQALPGCLNIDGQVGTTCGGGSSFFGINGMGQFEFNNVDGEFCCGSGGDFNSYFQFETVDISCFSDVQLSIDYSAALTNGQSSFEDDSPLMPIWGCGPNSNSHDQIFFEMTVYSNGTPSFWATQYIHGTTVADFTGSFVVLPFTIVDMTTLELRIYASNKAQGEHFYFENLLIEGITEADAGPDLVTCGTNPVNLMGTGSGTWSGGLGTFANNSDPMTTYTPSPADSPGPVILTWTCGPASANCPVTGSDDMEISFGSGAMGTMTSPTGVLCEGECIDVFFNVSGGSGGPYDMTFEIGVPGFPAIPITLPMPMANETTTVCTTTALIPSYDAGTNTAYIPDFLTSWTIQLTGLSENGCPGTVDGTILTFNIVSAPTANTGCSLEDCVILGDPGIFVLPNIESCINGTPGMTFLWFMDIGLTMPILVPGNYMVPSSTVVYVVVDDGTCQSPPVAVDLIVSSITAPASILGICNDGGTPSDPLDDFITFDLDPQSGPSMIGMSYTVTVSSGTITPNMGVYGGPMTFQLQPGSAGAGDVVITVTDNNYVGCSIPAITIVDPGACSFQCSLQADGFGNVGCTNNGTTGDATDDIITFDLNPSGLNLGPTYSIFVSSGTVTPSISGYGSVTSFMMQPGSAGGGNFTITIIDANDPSCTITIPLVDPGSCSSQCDILNEGQSNIICTPGSLGDGTDDILSFDLNPTGNNLGATYDVTVSSGSVLPTTGVYGSSNTFTMQPGSAGGGNIIVTIVDALDPTCTFTFTILDPGSCATPNCNITDQGIFQELCGDNGTASDPADDWWTFGLNPIGSNLGTTYTISVDIGSVTPSFGTYGQATIFQLQNGSATGGAVNVTITDDMDPSCSFTFVVTPTGSCSGACEITDGGSSPLGCDGNMTSITTDDFITFDLNPTGNNLGTTYTVTVSQGTITPTTGSYGMVTSFMLNQGSAGGGNVILTISDDDDPTCEDFVILIIDPGTCSGACSLDHTLSAAMCDDNGTPGDPSDDIFTLEITVTAMNGGSGWTADDPLSSSGPYGTPVTIGPYDIANGNVMFNLVDNDDPLCDINFTVVAPMPCSAGCVLEEPIVINTVCDANGTPVDDSDDVFFFEMTVTGSGLGSGWTSDDPLLSSGNYDQITLLGPYDIAAGLLTFNVTDNDNPGCTYEVMVVPPTACSTLCSQNAIVSNIFCFDNDTPSDPADDQFTFTLNVGGSNLGSGWTADDILGSAGNYNIDIVMGPYDIGPGGIFIFELTDNDDMGCTDVVEVPIPVPCSGACSIYATPNMIFDCDNNGTPADPSDDFYTFEILVTGTNTGAMWVADDMNNTTGQYGVATNMGPFLFADGDFFLGVEDIDDPSCSGGILYQPPVCPCEVFDAGLTNVQCNDNGTPTDPTDDFITFDLDPTGFSLGTSYAFSGLFPVVPSDGLYGQVTSFTLTLGSASLGDIVLIIQNNINPNDCGLEFTIPNPGPCSDDCSDEVDAGEDVTIDCFNEGALAIAMTMDNAISYTWTDAGGMVLSNSEEVTITNEGWIFVEAVFDNGCTFIDSLFATDIRNTPSAMINASSIGVIDCNTTEILLTSDMESNTTYTWTLDQETVVGDSFTASNPGEVTLEAFDEITGCSSMDIFIIDDLTEYPLIVIEAPEDLGCFYTVVELDASGSDSGPNIQYQWFDPNQNELPGETSSTLNVAQSGWYYFEAVDIANNCINFDSIFVGEGDPDITLDINSIAITNSQFNLGINTNVQDYTINWTPAEGLSCTTCPDPLATIDNNITYYATIEYGDSCTDTDSIDLLFLRIIDFYVPTAFSPNGDSFNETFGIYGDDPDAVVQDFYIFDRWGEIVFEARDYAPSSMNAPEWDGTFKNQDVVPGVYVYMINLIDGNGQERKMAGDITVLR